MIIGFYLKARDVAILEAFSKSSESTEVQQSLLFILTDMRLIMYGRLRMLICKPYGGRTQETTFLMVEPLLRVKPFI